MTPPNLTKRYARSSAKKSAAMAGVYFDLPPSSELPDVPACCPLCERDMTRAGEDRGDSPSMDRIIPGLGYTVQNIWWICHDCNRRKADLDPARAYAMWDLVWEQIKERGLPLPATRLRPRTENE